jgi:predicted nuclease with TOPRIM domain
MPRADSSQDDHRKAQLLKLYWNRATVKRELKSLQKERHELLDRLKEQEGAIVRAREQLDGLERLLVNPIAAANAMVYFQLRNVWRVASQRLEQFSGELEQQRLQRERKTMHEAALSKRQRRLAAIEDKANELRAERNGLAARAQKLEAKLAGMNSLVKLFKGRRLQARIERIERRAAALNTKLDEQQDLSDKIEGEPLPEAEGLSVESRRIVNTAVIALAQHLVVHFSANRIAESARESMHKTVVDMRFGKRRECDRMVENIRSRIADLKEETQLADLVKKRAAMIARELTYRNESDSLPSAFCIPQIKPSLNHENNGRRGSDAPIKVNVISDDYWDLSRYLR